MGRPVVLSNGQVFVGLDESGLVHDFYYPYVGLDNLNNARSSDHKIGVWVDGIFRWINDGSWHIDVRFEADALISNVTIHSDELQIKLHFTDFVDSKDNVLIRRIEVTNQADHQRDVRIFMHQVFQISRAGRADTAMYVPEDDYLLDYKGRCCLLIAGKFTNGSDFDQYAVGSYGIEGKDGTFRDAEDGELSGNAVEQGGVDSVLRFRQDMPAGAIAQIDYWIVAADSESDAQLIHTKLKYYSLDDRLAQTRQYWKDWLAIADSKIATLPQSYQDCLRTSLLIIKAHCDVRGSILASGDSSIFNYSRDYYCYCWPRDAAYALWPFIRLGYHDEARKFFEFARDTMHHDGYLMHKYQPDRAIGSTWHPLLHDHHMELAIQEDETATVIYMLGEYLRTSGDQAFVENCYGSFIAPCANFMDGFIDEATGLPHASYDLWEQKFLTSTYSVCTVIAGLKAAADMAEAFEHPEDAARWRQRIDQLRLNLKALYHPDGYYRKGFLLQADGSLKYDDTLDVSNFYGPYMFAGLPLHDPQLTSTLGQVRDRLQDSSPIGGVIRYEGDGYFLSKQQYKGNPWAVCTLWLAQYGIETGDQASAQKLLNWVIDREFPSGAISEQFDPETGYSLGVTPLVWSHAEMINTILDTLDDTQP